MKFKYTLIIGLGFTLLAHSETTPYTLTNGDSITLSGKATKIRKETFTLDYGYGAIVVEVDDSDWYSEMPYLEEGDPVTVSGKIDSDFGQSRSIEAGILETPDGITLASSLDEEDFQYPITNIDFENASEDSLLEVKGFVNNIRGKEFTLSFEGQHVNIDLDEMENPPLSKEGELLIRKGEFISVIGYLDRDLFEADEIKANSIVEF